MSLILNIIKFLFLFLFFIFLVYISFWIFFGKYEFLKIIYSFVFIIVFFYFWKLISERCFNTKFFNFINSELRLSLMTFFLLLPIIIKAPYLRYQLQNCYFWNKNKQFIIGSSNTHEQILESIVEMSEKKIGALITLEKYNSLQQFAEKSILIDGNVSKELLLNIFTPNTSLHDGGVIIRGNKILSAGTYFKLSENQHLKKTTGSRRRAAVGISEITDSMTILVSEETGDIFIALEGVLLKMKDINQIKEYLTSFIL